MVAQLSSSNTLGIMIEKLNFPKKTTHHPYGGEGGGDGRYFPHLYRSEIFWGFLNIYFQMPCAPGKRSDDMKLVGPTLLFAKGNYSMIFFV